MRKSLLGVGCVLAASLLGCSGAGGAGDNEGNEGSVTGVSLQLGTVGKSGAHYRLSPATFSITRSNDYYETMPMQVQAGTEDTLTIPLAPDYYSVRLNPEWRLQKVAADGSLTPVDATLTSRSNVPVVVSQFKTTDVNFAFHLGASGIDIGVTVDEGVPPGYDGEVVLLSPGQYGVNFQDGGSTCCWSTPQAAQAAWPNYHLLLPE